MRVRVEFTVDIDDGDRRIINEMRAMGDRPATRKEVRQFFQSYGTGGWVEIRDYEADRTRPDGAIFEEPDE